jgi:hypothetical protein
MRFDILSFRRSPLSRHHEIELGFIPLRNHIKPNWTEENLKFCPRWQGFDEPVSFPLGARASFLGRLSQLA